MNHAALYGQAGEIWPIGPPWLPISVKITPSTPPKTIRKALGKFYRERP